MKREPFIAHSELTNEIYIIVGKEKYRVTEQAIKAVKAIEALEQEPCDDAISRQYLIEKATNWEKHFHDSERFVSLTDIQNAPPVKPQEPILDKIKAEIMQLYNEVEVVDYDHNDISRIKKAHWIIREEVLWIIDKYNSCQKRGIDMRESEDI